jgi:K(+)-stimulated pyrophosphate-energized sodium pump
MFAAYLFSQNPALHRRSCRSNSSSPRRSSPSASWPSASSAWAPVTIAVDSFGPVTDNAQSVYELSQIEVRAERIKAEIEKDFGFKPDFENAKLQLEKGDGAGNTFKATAKPVLIGTAVVGATTMVFGIIMLLKNVWRRPIARSLSLVVPAGHPRPAHGRRGDLLVHRRQHQAVVTGAYRAVVYIKET